MQTDPLTAQASGRQFKMLRRIGIGGFGEVYLAEMSTSSGFTKTVALKLLRLDTQDAGDTARRMRDEAKMLGLLRHRAIVQADDLTTLKGRTAVVMEFVPGVNLSSIANPNHFPHQLSTRVALAICAEIADALEAAYSRPSQVTGAPLRVLHRDIKPANVRITPDGEVKILDFGIARADDMDREAHTRDYALGSIKYMAPELLGGTAASPSSDIYALGVTLYEVLARKRFGMSSDDGLEHGEKVMDRLETLVLTDANEAQDDIRGLIKDMLAYQAEGRPSALDVVRRCRELLRKIEGPTLQEWAPGALERILPPENVDEDGDLTGKTLYEELKAPEPSRAGAGKPLATVPPRSAGRKLVVLAAALGGVIGLLAVAGVIAAVVVSKTNVPSSDATAMVAAEEAAGDEGGADTVAAEEVDDEAGGESDETEPASPSSAGDAAGGEPPAEGASDEASSGEPSAAAEGSAAASAPASPGRTSSAATTAKPAASPSAAAASTQPTSSAPVLVKLSSVPFGITVYADGKDIGKTPQKLDMTPGPHVLMFVDGESTIRQSVTVTADGENKWIYRRAEGVVR